MKSRREQRRDVEDFVRGGMLKGKGGSATIGELPAAKLNRAVTNREGRLSAIEADALDPALLLERQSER